MRAGAGSPNPRASQLLESSKTAEKMYKLDEHMACAVAGITSDANILINTARVAAQRHTFTYAEPMPVEQLVQSLCDTKQARTRGVWRHAPVGSRVRARMLRGTHSLAACAPLASPSSSLAGTRCTASSCTRATLAATTAAGRRPPSARTRLAQCNAACACF